MTIKFDLKNKDNNFKKYEDVQSELIYDNCSDFMPLISIMIPTYKRPHLIKESLDSAINQNSDVNFEVVIVDNDADGEFDIELLKLVKTYTDANVRLFKNKENIGMFGNWNRCIELSRGEFFSILNDDDILSSEFISKVINQSECKEMIVTPRSVFYNSIPEFKIKKSHLKIIETNVMDNKDLLNDRSYSASLGILFHRQVAIDLGGYNEKLFPTSDLDFNNRYLYNYGQKEVLFTLRFYT
ncbi:glycosyltransferase family 2 protein [Vibrio cyclitrophicus]